MLSGNFGSCSPNKSDWLGRIRLGQSSVFHQAVNNLLPKAKKESSVPSCLKFKLSFKNYSLLPSITINAMHLGLRRKRANARHPRGVCLCVEGEREGEGERKGDRESHF